MLHFTLQVSNVRLPKEGTTNRPKGFGYAELGTRQDLEEALALTGEVRGCGQEVGLINGNDISTSPSRTVR